MTELKGELQCQTVVDSAILWVLSDTVYLWSMKPMKESPGSHNR